MPKEDDDVQWEESRPALTEQGEDGIIPFKLKSESGSSQDSPPPCIHYPGDKEDKKSWGGLATAGFFGLFLPTLLGSLLYLGVPTAQV